MPQPTPERALVRLPLQVGTTATWAVARAATALVPGLALLVLGAYVFTEDSSGELSLSIVLTGGLFVTYAGYYLRLVRQTRASDLLVFRDRLRVDGGSRHRTEIPWSELSKPWSGVEQGKSDRLTLWKLPLTAIAAVGGEGVDPTSKMPVWRLWVMRGGRKVHLAETDRAEEARSFRAAATTIAAINTGQRHVENAQRLETDLASCTSCSAPLVPDDATHVACGYCRLTVPLPERFRERAANVKSLERSRARTTRMIESLIDQPGATRTNLWIAVFSIPMFAAWPIGWGAIAKSVLDDGFQGLDVAFLASPLVAVLGCFLFARGRLADRGAMQLLTLGFGALAPLREGDPARCRRCVAPLPDVGIGGVAACRYCAAESIVGIDLRPVVDRERSEEKSFDRALASRRRERLKWAALTVVAVLVMAAWGAATVDYIEHPPEHDYDAPFELGDP